MTETRSPHFARDTTVQTYTSIHLPRVFAPWAKVLLEVVQPRPGDAVLDVATGPGTVARHAARLVGPNGRVTGVDISAAMLAVGRAWPPDARAAPIEYVESSASSIPLPDTTYDVAYCQQGLQHMFDPLAAVRDMHRVLKPAGRLGVAVWTQSPFGIFRQVVADMGMDDEGPQPSLFGRDAAELAEALRDVGFEDVEVQVRELMAVLEGGIPQALQVAEATSGGAVMASLSAERQQALRDAIATALQPHVKDGAVHLHSAANIATARKPV
jgi:ubiquinone/menaquinone biosynthesis C-methylase UbiE